MDSLLRSVQDQNLKFSLSFGVGIHHAGLKEPDRRTVEQLFVNQKIQVGIKDHLHGNQWPASTIISLGTYSDKHTGLGRQFPRSPGRCQGNGVL